MRKRILMFKNLFLLNFFVLAVREADSNDEHDTNTLLFSLMCLCLSRVTKIRTEMLRKQQTTYHPTQEMPVFDDSFFLMMFRFRKEHFVAIIDAMNLSDQSFRCGRKNKQQVFPADICLMVVLRRFAYPCRMFDLINIFGIDSTRLNEIFHTTIDWLYFTYAKALNQFSIWMSKFPEFAYRMKMFGAPYENLIGIFDGHFIPVCRPGGLGNTISRLDQRELYTGEKAQHGIKYLVAQFPNGMTAVSGPYLGKVNDQNTLVHSKWISLLRHIHLQTGRHYILFGDSGFTLSEYIQVMIRSTGGYYRVDDRRYNNLMSRIRIHIENTFGELSKVFSHFRFRNGLKLGGRNIGRQYEVANFFMNLRTIFYGNQFTAALSQNPACRMSISVEEFLSMAQSNS